MFLAKIMISALVDVDITCDSEFMDAKKCLEAAKNLL